jgi:hypothetical protein
VDTRVGQRVEIIAGAHQIGLQRGTEPVRQAPRGDIKDAPQDGGRLRRFLGTDLHASTGRQRAGDLGQAIGRRRRVCHQRQMGEINRQPHVRRRCRQHGSQLEVLREHAVGDDGIMHALPEEVDADRVPMPRQLPGDLEGVVA